MVGCCMCLDGCFDQQEGLGQVEPLLGGQPLHLAVVDQRELTVGAEDVPRMRVGVEAAVN